MARQLPLFSSDEEGNDSEGHDQRNAAAHNRDKRLKASDIEASPDDTEFSKYIVYVDESGDHSLHSIDENYPVFVLSFCIFHKRHYSETIVPALEKFKFNYFGHDQIVLHENEIRRRSGVFNIFASKSQQQLFMDDLTDIIEFSKFIIISTTIDKLKLTNNQSANAYHIALKLCVETLYEFLIEKGQENKKTHIVVERRGEKEDRELELEFRRVCDGQNKYRKILPLDIIFSDKKVMSSGLQLADLVARPIGLRTLRPAQENRAFNILEHKFYCEGGRENCGNDYFGVGMKVFPS